MSTSLYDAWVDIGTSLNAGENVVDPFMARAMANNALHFADEEAQVRVAWSVKDGGSGASAFALATPFTILPLLSCGPWPSVVHSSGIAYPLRVRLFARTSTGTATFYLAYSSEESAIYDIAQQELGETRDNVTSGSTTSATVGNEVTLATNLLSVSAAQTDAMRTTLNTINILGGTPDTIPIVGGRLNLWASISQAGTVTVDGIYAAEYCGV